MSTQCLHCGAWSREIAAVLSHCGKCIKEGKETVIKYLHDVHRNIDRQRKLLGPAEQGKGYPSCRICSRGCSPAPGERGFCRLRENRDGRLLHLAGTPSRGLLQHYYDPLPTNCVADWVCPARGQYYWGKNLAVFYGACTLNCLFCQNWQYRVLTEELQPLYSAQELAARVDDSTACICFFGGDPAPQAPHALNTARKALKLNPRLKICWETSGLMTAVFLEKMLALSLQSGGTVKFDIKAYNENLYFALTGWNNGQLFANFARCAEVSSQNNSTLAVASTLLVPGYIDADEVYSIASFIASIDPQTPYSLLGFYPHFYMKDLPKTRRKTARECYSAAREAGLKRVRLANEHLLI